MGSYKVKRMDREQVQIAVDWAAREGWNPGTHDAEAFWAIDPHGFFVGELDAKPIAVGTALAYDDSFGFCGFYIVDPSHRSSGYGLELTHARLAYMGGRNVGLDGVIDMSDKYARLGYKTSHISTRYAYTPTVIVPVAHYPTVLSADKVDFDELVEYDTRHFPTERTRFLKRWISMPNADTLVAVQESKICGFGVIRKCQTGYKIGPLLADSSEIAVQLFNLICNFAVNEPVYLDVPEPNRDAMRLAESKGMEKIFSCARMYLKTDPGLPINNIYGITTFEAG